ncbi:MAG: type II secretion system GspH family protein [Planctomycetales bacterium]|nr:type II secretion system GspH family protein [Planctomycetales bacterium]
MKTIRTSAGFTLTELTLVIAVSSILLLAIGIVMLDTQRGWMDSYAKVHGGVASDAAVAKTAFDKVVRKASRTLYYFDAVDNITVFYYNDWLNSTDLDRFARFFRPQDEPSMLYVQYGDRASGEVLSQVCLASTVTDLQFRPLNGAIEMKLTLEDDREAATMISTAILHNDN